MPDRPPVFDLVRNDRILSHFGGERLTFDNAAILVPRALSRIVDATRAMIRLPKPEGEAVTPDGRRVRQFRWTEWYEERTYASSEEYAAAHRRGPGESWDWNEEDERQLAAYLHEQSELQRNLGDSVFFWNAHARPDLCTLYREVGLDQFCYYMADRPKAVSDALERATVKRIQLVEHLPESANPMAVFLADDIAYKGATLFSPAWLRAEYFHRLARCIDVWHRRGIKVLFHSDGNLMEILDGLVEAGIDGLNPIEVVAGMDVGEIHRRHPHLFLCGGIDVSDLLTHGTPQQIRDVTLRAIEAGRGRLMVGSTTEAHNDVPLENYMAMLETAWDYRY